MDEFGCDMLSAMGKKFLRGPRGSGFLHVRGSRLESLHPFMIDHFAAPWVAPDRYALRPDARRFETWADNQSARLGLGAAADYALSLGLDAVEERCRALGTALRDGLREVPGVSVHDLGARLAAIVSFSVRDRDPDGVKASIARAGINVGTSKPSSTMLAASARSLPTHVRASPHYHDSEAELDRLLACVRSLAA